MLLTDALVALALLTASPPQWTADFAAERCPVVGNRTSLIYHTPDNPHYQMMLEKNRGADNRECFPDEAAAQAAGYRPSQARRPD